MAIPLDDLVTDGCFGHVFIFLWFVVYFTGPICFKIHTSNLLKFTLMILLVMVDVLRYCVGFLFGVFLSCFQIPFLPSTFFLDLPQLDLHLWCSWPAGGLHFGECLFCCICDWGSYFAVSATVGVGVECLHGCGS